MEKIAKTWLYPLCALVEMPFGSTCSMFKDNTCEHMDKIHVTGQFYIKEITSAKGVGISEISDEL